MQLQLREKNIGYKKEFIREILQGVRVREKGDGSENLSFPKEPPRKEEFFTLHQLVVSSCKPRPTSVVGLLLTNCSSNVGWRSVQNTE